MPIELTQFYNCLSKYHIIWVYDTNMDRISCILRHPGTLIHPKSIKENEIITKKAVR